MVSEGYIYVLVRIDGRGKKVVVWNGKCSWRWACWRLGLFNLLSGEHLFFYRVILLVTLLFVHLKCFNVYRCNQSYWAGWGHCQGNCTEPSGNSATGNFLVNEILQWKKSCKWSTKQMLYYSYNYHSQSHWTVVKISLSQYITLSLSLSWSLSLIIVVVFVLLLFLSFLLF